MFLKLSDYTDSRGSYLFSVCTCSRGAFDPDGCEIPTDSSGFGELSSHSVWPFSKTRWHSGLGEIE